VVEGPCVIGDECVVGAGAHVVRTLLLEQTQVSSGAVLVDGIVGQRTNARAAISAVASEPSTCALGSRGRGVWDIDCLADRLWNAVAEPALTVLFPPRCVGCGDFESYLCSSCRDTLEAIGDDSCPRCGEPGPVALVGGRCAHSNG
jgi:NDP-sugar pyrophosphorylase family protein